MKSASKITISEEQAQLAEDIKSVHLSLRRRAQEIGAQQAWKEHLAQQDVLSKYATSMKSLAEHHWAKNNDGERKSYCRIRWIVKEVFEYYGNGGYERQNEKESKRFGCEPITRLSDSYVFKVLDVGSCYNPFKEFDFLDVYPIDLCPATDRVKKCNFLTISTIENKDDNWWSGEEISEIPNNWFHAVIFCLLLEYLPSEEQREEACSKAWQVLQPGGLLLIVTPDSKHSSANAQLMKSWKFALLKLGFVRITLEKLPYLYCMTFRKSLVTNLYLDTLLNIDEKSSLAIPQDFVDYSSAKPSQA